MTTLVQKRVFAALPRTQRGKSVRITGDPKGRNFLYCNGNSVYIRNIEDPSIVDIYTEHSKPTTMARYSPSGFYIASGDASGKVRIWDTVNPEHILKSEYQIIGGEVRDLSWCPESKKIALCGQGRDKLAHVFNMDTGTSVGEIAGHTIAVNTISYRPCRPFRIVTASEDMTVKFFEGPPFKFKKTGNKHTNFCNVARYSPDGNVIISGGADGKLFKYDGEELDDGTAVEIGSPKAHAGGIYEICFSPDSRQVLTASGDKTAKIFDVESGEQQCVFDMDKGENKWENMQLGCLWQNNEIISVNARGHIIYHNYNDPTMPKRIIKGHMKPITSLALSEDRTTAFTAGQEGIIYWDIESGNNDSVSGKGHGGNEVTDMVIDGNNLLSVGVDDTLRVTSVSNKNFSDTEIKLASQPKQIDSRNGIAVVACVKHVMVLEGGRGHGDSSVKKVSEMAVEPEASCVSIHPNGSQVAVGFKTNEIRIYSLQNGQLSEQKKILIEGDVEVDCIAYSPDEAYLAYGANRKVGVLSTENYERIGLHGESHTARVMCLAWSPDSQRFATGSLDSTLKLWNPEKMVFDNRPSIKAYPMSHTTSLAWVDAGTIITSGHDSNVKQFALREGQQQQQQQTKR